MLAVLDICVFGLMLMLGLMLVKLVVTAVIVSWMKANRGEMYMADKKAMRIAEMVRKRDIYRRRLWCGKI